MTFYMEGDNLILSGDAKFVWNQTTNQIYDIENSLSTFFMWPGDLVNTHVYVDLDLFSVDESRSLMVT